MAIIHISEGFYYGTLRFYDNGYIEVFEDFYDYREYKNKYAILGIDDVYSAFNEISKRTYISSTFAAGDYVWCHPKARISRDLLRKSDYSITRDPDKADYIVIPQPDYDQFYAQKYRFACLIDGALTLYQISDTYNRKIPTDNSEFFERAKDRIIQYHSNNVVEILCDDLTNKCCGFIPGLEIYKDVIEKGDLKNYVFDTKIQLTPSVNISPETLDLWSRLDDMNMLSKFVCQSDWKEYPFTLCMFLRAEQWSISYQQNNNIKMVLKEIGFDEGYGEDRPITKKDFDMLMAYTFHKIGKTPNACYITAREFNEIPAEYRRFLKTKAAVCPFSFTGEQTMENIKIACRTVE